MLTFDDYDRLSLPTIQAYIELEQRLILKISERILADNGELSGTVEWWIKKLDEMGLLRRDIVQEIAETAQVTPELVENLIEQTIPSAIDTDYYIQAYETGLAKQHIDNISLDRVIKANLDEITGEFKAVQTNAIQGAQDAFVKATTQAHLETTTGLYSYDQAIERSVRELVDKGITVATYKRQDGTEVNYGIESVVRRITMTGISQVANSTAEHLVEELGSEHVAVSQHYGARNKGTGHENHEKWQGKVYKIEGSDEKYKNFYEETGYGEVDGLGGVNCRHTFFAYFPGISVPHKKVVDDKENSRIYELTQEQRRLERQVRNARKRIEAFEALEDEEAVKHNKKLLKRRLERLNDFVEENSDVLKRDYARERIYT